MKVFIFIFILIGAITLKAQMCPCEFGNDNKIRFRNELSINLANLNEDPNSRHFFYRDYKANYINGIMFKHHLDKYSLRAGFDFITSDYKHKILTSQGSESYEGSNYYNNLRLGVEKTVLNKFIQVYLASDLIFSKSNHNGIYKYSGWPRSEETAFKYKSLVYLLASV
jgi:hypothetical protein